MADIFISYRSDDATWGAPALTESLERLFGREIVFEPSRSIRVGMDFSTQILNGLHNARVLLVVMGTKWLSSSELSGLRRIDRADDWVRREISTALSVGIPIVPVLVDGARMPAPSDLPLEIKKLASLQAYRVNRQTFGEDVSSLVDVLSTRLSLPPVRVSRNVLATAEAWLLSFPAFTEEELRSRGKDPGAPRLIRLSDPNGSVRLPSFQFDARGEIIPVVAQVNRILEADEDPWGAASWWLELNARIGAAPVELLGEDNDELLVSAAESAVAEV